RCWRRTATRTTLARPGTRSERDMAPLTRAGWLMLLVAFAVSAVPGETPNAQRLRLTVTEPAGIRRFGYPVHAVVSLNRPATAKDRFRLLDNGKPVAAQIQPVANGK